MAVFLLLAFSAAAQEPRSVREIINTRSPLMSPDGAFRVGAASELLKPQRFTVLNLCRSLRQRLAVLSGGVATLDGDVIYILIGAEKRNDEGIFITRPADFVSHFVEVADVETVNPALLEALLAQCVLNNWLAVAQRRAGANVREEVPLWFARGMAVFADFPLREACFDALEEWTMAGNMKPVAELLQDGGGTPALPPLLVAWLLETSRRQANEGGPKSGYARLHEALAKGAAWPGASLPEAMLGMTPPQAQESWDLWLHQCRSKIFNPGAAATGALARLRQVLYVYPVATAMLLEGIQRGRTFAELAAMQPSPWRKRVAEQRIIALRTSAAGRDDRYKEVVEGYCDFLTALAKKQPLEKLNTLLATAEARYLAAYGEAVNADKEQPDE